MLRILLCVNIYQNLSICLFKIWDFHLMSILPQFLKSVTNPVHPMINFLNANSLTCEIAFFFPPFLNLTLLFQIQMSELPLETSGCPSFFHSYVLYWPQKLWNLKAGFRQVCGSCFIPNYRKRNKGRARRRTRDKRWQLACLRWKRVRLHVKHLHMGRAVQRMGPGPTRRKANLQQILRKVSVPRVSTVKKTSPKSFYCIKISVTCSDFSKFLFWILFFFFLTR